MLLLHTRPPRFTDKIDHLRQISNMKGYRQDRKFHSNIKSLRYAAQYSLSLSLSLRAPLSFFFFDQTISSLYFSSVSSAVLKQSSSSSSALPDVNKINCTYSSHYILLCGYQQQENTIFYRNPALDDRKFNTIVLNNKKYIRKFEMILKMPLNQSMLMKSFTSIDQMFIWCSLYFLMQHIPPRNAVCRHCAWNGIE